MWQYTIISHYQFTPFDITVLRAALTLASIMALSVWLLLDGGWRSSDSDNASVLPVVGVKCDNTLYQFIPFDSTVSWAALTLASIMALSVWLLLDGGWRSSDSDNASVLPFNREDSCRERGKTEPLVQCQANIQAPDYISTHIMHHRIRTFVQQKAVLYKLLCPWDKQSPIDDRC